MDKLIRYHLRQFNRYKGKQKVNVAIITASLITTLYFLSIGVDDPVAKYIFTIMFNIGILNCVCFYANRDKSALHRELLYEVTEL